MDIVEPHMYDVDAAVAKIDGYIISVLRGGRSVGQRRLVRVDEVGRTGATASLVGGDEPEGDGGDDGGDDLESPARRRGRRGGRRRSRAKTETQT